MRITIESDPGYAGRAMAQHIAARIRAAVPGADVVITGPAPGPRLPANYSAVATQDHGVRMMLRGEAH